ncbi:MAG: hypothetical protein RJB58_2585 [Pseudomonadota bacterium]|jgi:integrase
MALTDAVCRSAKPGPKRRKLSDGSGLQLWVQTSGARLWQLAYRFQGRQRQLALGRYPEISLAEARIKREDARRLLRAGDDPAAAARRAPRPGDTFKDVAHEFIEKCRSEKLAAITIEKKEWLLEFAYPQLGHRRLSEIEPFDVLGVLQEVEKKGRYETTRRLRATIGAVFRYGVATARAKYDPTIALRGATIAPKVTHRAAITDTEHLGRLLRAIDSIDGQLIIKAGLQLLALTFPRPGELRFAQWSEFDLGGAVWTIPAHKTKMGREHRVSLSRQALAVLGHLRNLTGHRELLLPAMHNWKKPISENAFNLALRRLGFGADEMTAHGFRATASTLLNESGKWAEDAIERQLAHIEKNGVRRAYARGRFWDERVLMMQWWADYQDQLKVLPEPKAKAV